MKLFDKIRFQFLDKLPLVRGQVLWQLNHEFYIKVVMLIAYSPISLFPYSPNACRQNS